MANTIEWAEKEVALAKKKNKDDLYNGACYDDALRALKAIGIEKHSGMSWGFTTGVLYRLMRHLPLTPITEKDFKDVQPFTTHDDGHTSTQCPRMWSLFKDIWPDGKVQYHDQERAACIDADTGDTFYSWMGKILDELYPIKLPYMPEAVQYEIYYKDEHWRLADDTKGKADLWISTALFLLTPDRQRLEINRHWVAVPGMTEQRELTAEEYEKIQKNGKLVKSRRSKR